MLGLNLSVEEEDWVLRNVARKIWSQPIKTIEGTIWSILFAESDSSHLLREELRKTSGRSRTVRTERRRKCRITSGSRPFCSPFAASTEISESINKNWGRQREDKKGCQREKGGAKEESLQNRASSSKAVCQQTAEQKTPGLICLCGDAEVSELTEGFHIEES